MNNKSKEKLKTYSKSNNQLNEENGKTRDNNVMNTSEDTPIVCIDLTESTDGSVDGNRESDDATVVDEQIEEEVDSSEENNTDEEDLDLSSLDIGRPKKKPKLTAKFCQSIKGDENPLYSVQFNNYLPDGHKYFAAVGADRLTIYECPSNGNIRLVSCFAEPTTPEEVKDKKKCENYYAVCWSVDEVTNNCLAICGGKRGVIRIIDCVLNSYRHLTGHGGAINDLKVSPHDHNLLLSSSEDYSLRLWNLKTNVCIAKFGGESGHRDQVLSADFYLLSGKYFVSSGMDHSIKIWSLNRKTIRKAINKSNKWKESKGTFPMESIHFPVFTTRTIHTNYVDCVQFLGRYLLSKSCNNEIICSKPDVLDNKEEFIENKIPNEAITRLGAFKTEENTLWFIKFSMDFEQELMSVGNGKGVAYVWDMTEDNPYEYEPLVLKRKKCTTIIRQTSFSRDGKTLICVCDDSSIWRWDITRE